MSLSKRPGASAKRSAPCCVPCAQSTTVSFGHMLRPPRTELILWRVRGANYKAFSDAAGAAASIGTFGLCGNAARRLCGLHGQVLVVVWYACLREALTSYLQSLGLAPEKFIVRTALQAKGTEAKAAVVVAQRRRCHEQHYDGHRGASCSLGYVVPDEEPCPVNCAPPETWTVAQRTLLYILVFL